jgi:calcium-dependent protein kinase
MFLLKKLRRLVVDVCAGGRTDAFRENYMLDRRIGSGGFGNVHRCRLRLPVEVTAEEQQSLAVKILSKTRPGRSDAFAMRRIRDEISVMRALRGCPQVARFVDLCEDEQHVYLVMELCAGGDLNTFVKQNGTMAEPALRAVAQQVLKMLSACHSLGIVYGDVKPANFCVFDRFPSIKAVDFGCSRYVVEEGQRFGSLTGTPAFMAPEVFRRNYSFKADVYSLGVMLFWLSSARFPLFEDRDIDTMTVKDIDDLRNGRDLFPDLRLRLGKVLSPEGIEFVGKCLLPEPGRPTAKEALNLPWLCE